MLRASLSGASFRLTLALTPALILSTGCWQSGPHEAKSDGNERSPYLRDSDLQAAASGMDLDGLLDEMPSDMRENLGNNELRRKRANDWVAKNLVGKTLEIELTVVEVDSFERTDGKRWVRVWLEEPVKEIFGEETWLSAGPGFTPQGPLFGSSAPAGLDWSIVRTVIFGPEETNPSYAVIEVADDAAAEKLVDLRQSTATVRGAVREIAFYPNVSTFGRETGGGLRIRLADATVNGLPVVPGLPVTEKPTNSWGIAYEPMPVGEDIEGLFGAAKLNGGDDDANAVDWTPEPVYGTPDSLEGQWYGRWRSSGKKDWVVGNSPADIAVQDDRLLIRFIDDWGTNLIVLKRESEGDYRGRYLNAAYPTYCGPIVARVASPERIDAAWYNDDGDVMRWDFRRRIDRESFPLQNFLDSSPTTP